jgi:hypothetical protein
MKKIKGTLHEDNKGYFTRRQYRVPYMKKIKGILHEGNKGFFT